MRRKSRSGKSLRELAAIHTSSSESQAYYRKLPGVPWIASGSFAGWNTNQASFLAHNKTPSEDGVLGIRKFAKTRIA